MQAISDDQTTPIVLHKQSVAEISSCKALPNTYTKLKESEKKGEICFDCEICIDKQAETFFLGGRGGGHN